MFRLFILLIARARCHDGALAPLPRRDTRAAYAARCHYFHFTLFDRLMPFCQPLIFLLPPCAAIFSIGCRFRMPLITAPPAFADTLAADDTPHAAAELFTRCHFARCR